MKRRKSNIKKKSNVEEKSNVEYRYMALKVLAKDDLWIKRWENLQEILETTDDIVIQTCGNDRCTEMYVWMDEYGDLTRHWVFCVYCNEYWCSEHECDCSD